MSLPERNLREVIGTPVLFGIPQSEEHAATAVVPNV